MRYWKERGLVHRILAFAPRLWIRNSIELRCCTQSTCGNDLEDLLCRCVIAAPLGTRGVKIDARMMSHVCVCVCVCVWSRPRVRRRVCLHAIYRWSKNSA